MTHYLGQLPAIIIVSCLYTVIWPIHKYIFLRGMPMQINKNGKLFFVLILEFLCELKKLESLRKSILSG